MTSTKRVVINASPLITLCRSQLHPLLPQLFEAVYVPDAVVIVLAKRRGLLPKAEPAFRQLQSAGLWLAEELIVALLQEAGELPASP